MLLPDAALVGLRSIVESDLVHSAERQTVRVTRLEGGETVETPTWSEPVDALLLAASPADVELAASRGVQAQWVVKLRLAEPVVPGEVWRISGDTDGSEWTRVVRITGDLGLTARIARRVAAVDTVLNQGTTT